MKLSVTRKVFGFSVIFIILLLTAGYYRLGGFNGLSLETITVNNYDLVGLYFEGSYKSDTVRAYFEKMKGFIDDDRVEGQVVIIYDQEPQGKRGYTKGFIGIRLIEPPLISLHSLEKRFIPTKRSVRISKDAHISVMPNPDKIDRLIIEYADSNDLELSSMNIELYYPNNRLVVERPIKEQI